MRCRGTFINRLAIFGWAATLLISQDISLGAGKSVNGDYTSGNWSGYFIVAGSGQTFSDITSTWTVPNVAGQPATYSSCWIGLDGISLSTAPNNTVEQCGTSANVNADGTTSYYAWYEFYPNSEIPIAAFNVQPGDKIAAEVNVAGNSSYTFTVNDLTAKAQNLPYTFTTTQTWTFGQQASAEWITESPGVSGTQSTLANYGSVTYSNNTANLTGTSALLDSFVVNDINMVQNGDTVSTTSGPDANGNFTTTYTGPEPSSASILMLSSLCLLARRPVGRYVRR